MIRWLEAQLLHWLFCRLVARSGNPYVVQAGDRIILPGKNKERTSNRDQLVTVTKTRLHVWVEYQDGSSSAYVYDTPGQLALAKGLARLHAEGRYPL